VMDTRKHKKLFDSVKHVRSEESLYVEVSFH